MLRVRFDSGEARQRALARLIDAAQTWRGRGAGLAMSIVVLAIATLAGVATRGLTETVRYQVADSFDSLAATQVTADINSSRKRQILTVNTAPVQALAGVQSAGRYAVSETFGDVPSRNQLTGTDLGLPRRIYGVERDLLNAADCRGDRFVPTTSERILWMGHDAAIASGLGPDALGDRIWLGGVDYVYQGSLPDCPRMPGLNAAVVMPLPTLERWIPQHDNGHVFARTDTGAALGIALALPSALNPTDTTAWTVSAPPDPRLARQRVDAQLALGGLAIALLLGALGGLSVAATMGSVVHDRAAEFGLRRSMGETRRGIAMLVIGDSAMIGVLASALGVAGGVLVVVGVSLVRGWIPVIDVGLTLVTALAIPMISVIAGLVPGWRAANTDPVKALTAL